MPERVRQIGTELRLGDGQATETFTPVIQLTSVGGLKIENEVIELVHHQLAGRVKEKLATFANVPDLPFSGYYDPADATLDGTDGLHALVASGEERNFEIAFPQFATPQKFSFSAVVQSFGPDEAAADGEALTYSGVLSVSGLPTGPVADS